MCDGFFCEEYGRVFAFFNKSLEIFLEKSLVWDQLLNLSSKIWQQEKCCHGNPLSNTVLLNLLPVHPQLNAEGNLRGYYVLSWNSSASPFENRLWLENTNSSLEKKTNNPPPQKEFSLYKGEWMCSIDSECSSSLLNYWVFYSERRRFTEGWWCILF